MSRDNLSAHELCHEIFMTLGQQISTALKQLQKGQENILPLLWLHCLLFYSRLTVTGQGKGASGAAILHFLHIHFIHSPHFVSLSLPQAPSLFYLCQTTQNSLCISAGKHKRCQGPL